jgi:endonuclease/exonuclease/phosphatase family metal-dependent hydrolase
VELVVLTQNILGAAPFWPYRKKKLAEVIRRIEPDVVGLQEVRARSPFDGASQAHELSELLGDYSVDFAPARIGSDGRCEGVAVLYRHSAFERSVTALTIDNNDRWDRTNPRVVLSCSLDVAGARVQVFAAHLSLSRSARVRTLKELSSAVADARERTPSDLTVILGDFNAPPGEEALARLCRATHEPWLDAWAALHGSRGGYTWPTPLPCRRIDYVFFQLAPGLSVQACHRLSHLGSDHCALWARVAGDTAAAGRTPEPSTGTCDAASIKHEQTS